jgi:2-C-methyl-D-erythritol 4-phosphate cytidylyltransferase
MEKFAVIVAGGSGLRMGTDKPKQFLLLNGKPVLWHTINQFLNAYIDLNCILVLPQEHIAKGEEIKEMFNVNANRITIAIGGATRFDSVKNGLKLIDKNAIVFVHDGVRCLVDESLIKRCYQQATVKGSAIPAVAATDSIRIVETNTNKVADRNNVRIIQTPQTFLSNLLLEAFEQEFNEGFTDEATVVEAMGKPVFLCDGDYNNIKITRPIDLLIAESILASGK